MGHCLGIPPLEDSFPTALVFLVTNDSVTLVFVTFCSSGLEAASVENW